MWLLYYLVVKLYGAAIILYSPFNKKAAKWVRGRYGIFRTIKKSLQPNEKRIWFHCPSLGEFEQGKPVLDALRLNYPNHKIVLTFFSPSGYEVKKNDPIADYVFFLPLDGPSSSSLFIKWVDPSLVFFVKYDFWHYYIKELHKKRIPIITLSSIFRPSQIYFKPYGNFFRNILKRCTHLFVQNQQSLELLYRYDITQVTVSGDTRFDRVYENSRASQPITIIADFKSSSHLLVAGSTWDTDEKLIAELINHSKGDLKFVIAPHEINRHRIENFIKSLHKKSVLISNADADVSQFEVMIIDNMGMLRSIYAYADISYVGGGFGVGIHNTLEAIAFGAPVLFGPNYEKFQEARELVERHGAFVINNSNELIKHVSDLLTHTDNRLQIGKQNLHYIESRKGALNVVMNYLRINYPE